MGVIDCARGIAAQPPYHKRAPTPHCAAKLLRTSIDQASFPQHLLVARFTALHHPQLLFSPSRPPLHHLSLATLARARRPRLSGRRGGGCSNRCRFGWGYVGGAKLRQQSCNIREPAPLAGCCCLELVQALVQQPFNVVLAGRKRVGAGGGRFGCTGGRACGQAGGQARVVDSRRIDCCCSECSPLLPAVAPTRH